MEVEVSFFCPPAALSAKKIDEQWTTWGPFVTPLNAAKALGVRTKTVRRWAEAGMIRYVHTYGSGVPKYTYNANDVQALAEQIAGYERPGLWLLRLLVPSDRHVTTKREKT
jgi:hypothetical protein